MADEEQQPEESGTEPAAREAARWRRRVRELEAERDQLLANVSALRRAEVERLAAGHLVDPNDLFDLGKVEVGSLLDGDGRVDAGKVGEAASALVRQRPYLAPDWAPPATNFDGGARATHPESTASWASVLSAGRAQ